jgi:hypothetical protein
MGSFGSVPKVALPNNWHAHDHSDAFGWTPNNWLAQPYSMQPWCISRQLVGVLRAANSVAKKIGHANIGRAC